MQISIDPVVRGLSPRAASVLFVLAVCVATLIWVALQGEDTNWDRRHYHFYTGYALVEGRFNRDVGVADLQTYLNPYVNAVTYLATAKLPFPIGAWLIAALQLVSVPLLLAISLRVLGPSLGSVDYLLAILATSFGLLSPSWLSELGTSFFSSTTAPLILASVLLCLRYLQTQSRHSGRLLILFVAGFLLGLAVGLKLTNAPYPIAAAVALIASLSLARSEMRIQVRALAALATGGMVGALPGLPWHLWLADKFQNPVFPLYNALFKSDYFEPSNFRDMRWKFADLPDFLSFVVAATKQVDRTGEIAFADARWAILAAFAILVPVSVLVARGRRASCQSEVMEESPPRAFMVVFVLVGTAIWADVLAYQRYLIPVELLFGPFALILAIWIARSKAAAAGVMLAALAATIVAIKIPDWGHTKVLVGESSGPRRPFDLRVPERFQSTPARYLIFGLPNSFLVPFLHEGSVVSRADLSAGFRQDKFNQLTIKRFAEADYLPLRLIGNADAIAAKRHDALRTIGYRAAAPLECEHFLSAVEAFVICELVADEAVENRAKSEPKKLEASFTSNDLLPSWVISTSGLSHAEVWGTWSDGDEVRFFLASCLPSGVVTLKLTGHAFGPNIGSPVRVRAGKTTGVVKFTSTTAEQTVSLGVDALCVDQVSLVIPTPTSPFQLGQSADSRRLGIGLTKVQIVASPEPPF